MKRFMVALLSLILILCLAPVSVLAEIDAAAISPGESTVEITIPGEEVYVSFTPGETGIFAFFSEALEDTCCRLLNSSMEELANDDDGGEDLNFRLVYKLTGGECYYYAVSFLSDEYTGSVSVKLEELAYCVESMKVLSEPDSKAVFKGHHDIPDLTGLQLEITWSDGQVDVWDGAINAPVRGENVTKTMNFGDENSTVAQLILTVTGQSISLEYPIIEDPVVKMELLAAPAFKLIFESDGFMERRYTSDGFEDFFYYYYSYNEKNIRVRFTMADGSTEDRYLGDTFLGYSIWLNDPQYEEHWTMGDNNRLYVRFLDYSAEVPVSVIEDPVAGFEVIEPAFVELIEDVDGWMTTYYNYDTGELKEFFRYSLDSVYDTMRFRINYKDGTSRIVEYGETIDGGWVFDCTDQESTPWTLGDDNLATFAFRDFTATLPVHILKNPIDRIEVTTAPTKEYMMGDPEFGYTYNGVYELYPSDLTGITFTIYYADGTNRQVTDQDLETGESLYYLLDGYGISVFPIADPTLGSNTATLMYMGKKANYAVSVVESIIQEVKLTKEPDNTEYYPGYFPDLRGAQFEITFKDGTKKTVTITDGSYDYFTYQLRVKVKDEVDLFIWMEYTSDQSMQFVAACMDKSCTLDCLNEVKGKQPVRVVPIKAGVQEYDTEFTLYFEDGTSEKVVVEPFKRTNPDTGARTMTDGGVIYVDVREDNGTWILFVQDLEAPLESVTGNDFLKGDVDGDGEITSTDARLTLQLAVKKIKESDVKVPAAGDVDGDGAFTSTDARLILQYSVHKITQWP